MKLLWFPWMRGSSVMAWYYSFCLPLHYLLCTEEEECLHLRFSRQAPTRRRIGFQCDGSEKLLFPTCLFHGTWCLLRQFSCSVWGMIRWASHCVDKCALCKAFWLSPSPLFTHQHKLGLCFIWPAVAALVVVGGAAAANNLCTNLSFT